MRKIEKETEEKLNKLNKHMTKTSSDKNDRESKPKKVNKKSGKPSFKTIEVVILILLTTIISLIVGSIVTYKMVNKGLTYSKADKELGEFLKIYDEITSNYYEKIDKQQMIEGAISGLLGTLDENTGFYNDTDANNLSIKLEGAYKGLGIEIYNNEDGDIVILNVFENSPASKQGLKPKDILIRYNDKNIKNTKTIDFVNMVRGENVGQFKLTYLRDGEEKTITVQNEDVILKSVASKTYDDDKIGYLYTKIFAANTAEQFKKELRKLETKKIKSLIIDLRSNSGGRLTAAEDIISLFLDKSHPIYQIDDKGKITTYYSKGKETKKYKIIVLVDSLSASASEVVASALKEQYGATLIGQKTFGKGTVQELQMLTDETYYKYTAKKWLTSKGETVDKKGFGVDFEIGLGDEYSENPSDENDQQLQKALEEARK